jgi:type IV secretory pathway TrbL component
MLHTQIAASARASPSKTLIAAQVRVLSSNACKLCSVGNEVKSNVFRRIDNYQACGSAAAAAAAAG